jgi:nucleotide-binding universal stress UspA family protein
MTPKRILVPLSGAVVDETVLSVVTPTASRLGATVRLLHVAPLPHNLVNASGRVVMYADQEMERLGVEWAGYLAEVAAILQDVATERVVRFGDVTHEIVADAKAWGAELIAMTSAGKRSRWLGGRRTVAAVSRRVRIPILLYQVG